MSYQISFALQRIESIADNLPLAEGNTFLFCPMFNQKSQPHTTRAGSSINNIVKDNDSLSLSAMVTDRHMMDQRAYLNR